MECDVRNTNDAGDEYFCKYDMFDKYCRNKSHDGCAGDALRPISRGYGCETWTEKHPEEAKKLILGAQKVDLPKHQFENLDGFELRLDETVSNTGEFHFVAKLAPENIRRCLEASCPDAKSGDFAFRVICDVSGVVPACRYYLEANGTRIEVTELFNSEDNALLFGKEVLLGIDYYH